MSASPTKNKTAPVAPFQQKKKNNAVASLRNTKASALAAPLPSRTDLPVSRWTPGPHSNRKDVAVQQTQRSQVMGGLSRNLPTLRSLRKLAIIRACRQWARFRRGRLACPRQRLRVYYKKRRATFASRTKWILRVPQLYSGRRRTLRRNRDTVLFHYRSRRVLFSRAVWRSLRRKYNSRTRQIHYRTVRVFPILLTRRKIMVRSQDIQPYLRRRKRRFARFTRAASRAAPERRIRAHLHRLIRRLTVAAVRRLRVPTSRQLYTYRSRDLRGTAYTLRKTRDFLQYGRLYSRHTVATLGRIRAAAIRFLRFRRQTIRQKARPVLHVREAGGRRGRHSPRRPQHRRWFLRRARPALRPHRHHHRGPRRRPPQLPRRVQLRYPLAAGRILRLQIINQRIKRSFSFQHHPLAARPRLRFVCRRQGYKQNYVGAVAQRLLRRVTNTLLPPPDVFRRLQSPRSQEQLRAFVRQIGELSRKWLLPHWHAKRRVLNFLSVSRGLHRRQYFAPSVLSYPAAGYLPGRSRRNFVRRLRPIWYVSRRRLRAHHLRFLRGDRASSLFTNTSLYCYPHSQNNEKISISDATLLRAQAKAVYLNQLAATRGVRRARILPRACISPSLVLSASTKFAQMRSRVRLYSRARFVLRGLYRKPRFKRVRRITRIYQRRRLRAKRKLARVSHRMRRYCQSTHCFKWRAIPAQVLKTARSGRLTAVRSGAVVRRWKRFRFALLRGRIRIRRLRQRLRALYRRSRRRRKPFRRWRNKRYKGRWWNFRRPAWLNKQYAPRRLKLRKSFVLLPTQRALTARLAWLLGRPPHAVAVEEKPELSTASTIRKPVSEAGIARPFQNMSISAAAHPPALKSVVASPSSSAAGAVASRVLWAKIFATKGNQPAVVSSTSASPHGPKPVQQPSISTQDKKKQ